MTPKRAQILLRLPEPLKLAAVTAAAESDQTVNDWLIGAIKVQLGADDSPTDSSELAGKLSEIDSRLAAIDSRLIALESKPAPKQRGGLTEEERDAIAAAKRPTDRPTAADKPPAPPTEEPQHQAAAPTAPTTKPPGKGLSQEDALKTAGYKGSTANAKRDLGDKGSTPQQWLEDRGWSQVKGRWYPPGV